MFQDQRKSPRKVYRTKAMLAIDGQPPVGGKTTDVGTNGVSVSLADPLAVGQGGQLAFDLLVEGSFVTINTRVKVSYCIFSSGEFKVGFQFLQPDLAAVTALARFMR
ncbi:PilZ domain-containing protein [Massilia oculi]|uniref:PilZ domain-containing protein n=1 Tax=Massilia oculi TaxID=945844 RepID=UPI0028AAFF49|nr:PilZ domain-containing protein [Massilia oculi]